MRERSEVGKRKKKEAPKAVPTLTIDEDVIVPIDPISEQVLVAAASLDPQSRKRLVRQHAPDNFLVEVHQVIWYGLREITNRGLEFDLATMRRVVGDKLDDDYLTKLLAIYTELPSEENLRFHEATFAWDRQRANAVEGPIAGLIEAIRNPNESRERVCALARHVAEAFEGGRGAGRYLLDPKELVRENMTELDRRIAGQAVYPYGIDGLDYDDNGERRMIMGAAPGLTTVVTAVTGGGKSTFVGHIALGLMKQKRRSLYAAWETKAPMTLELLACIDLGWSRTDVRLGANFDQERRILFEERQHEIGKWVRFMSNPFRRMRGEKATNEQRLDLVQEHILDSGAEVFIADLWARCLRDKRPEAEEDALWRQQAMAEELGVHNILLHQQRHKDIEMRQDKRPTREGIKGSGAYLEVADAVIAPHRPALWKRVDDNRLEVFILKQRDGKWPLGIEFDWEADKGSINGGRGITYEPTGEQGGDDDRMFSTGSRRKKKREPRNED